MTRATAVGSAAGLKVYEKSECKVCGRLGSKSIIYINDTSVPEGLVDGSVPADEGHGGEEDEPKDGQAKVNTIGSCVCCEVSQAGQQIEEEGGTVDWEKTQEGNQ